MQDEEATDLRQRLRDELFALTLEFGPTFPVAKQKVGKSKILDASHFPGCYSDLEVLCHYTDSSGLEGILKSGSFWATNVAYLNDPEEFRFAYRTFEDMVSRGDHALDKALVGSLINGLRTGGRDEELDRTFIISFSARPDDLSQFRAYSDNGRGYALVFDPCALVEALNGYLRHGSAEYFTLRQVRYGIEDLSPFHERAIEALKRCIGVLPNSLSSEQVLSVVRAFGMVFHDYLREAGVVFKQAGYKNEEEYRAVLDISGLCAGLPLDLDEKLDVRFRGAMPVPYIPVQFLPDSSKRGYFPKRESKAGMQRVVVGPSVEVPPIFWTGR